MDYPVYQRRDRLMRHDTIWHRRCFYGSLFGKRIVCGQLPLQRKLTDVVSRYDFPVVVDSIRDTVDIRRDFLRDRPVVIWFIDCSDSIIRQRLTSRRKNGSVQNYGPSPVDHNTPILRERADRIIPNFGSLEDLRWRTDDTLFATTVFTSK